MKKHIVSIIAAIGLMILIVTAACAKSQGHNIKLDLEQAISHSAYFDGEWPSCKHIYTIKVNGSGKLRVDMSGRANTWPVMDITVGKHRYSYTSQDGNSLHVEIPIKSGRKVGVEWGLTQGDFPEFYSYRFVLDP